ncbi:uncharacterized protein [Littorina saxatilis]|uniref:uncharacterized protein n=1 Tax=Littorina saxatilis TaxID=31220 RepID=UPI0038B6A3C0
MAQQGASGSQAAGVSQGSAPAHPDRTFWRDRVNEWYPRWRERTYFVPPVIMYRTDHDTVQVAGVDVRVPRPPVSKPLRGAAPALQESEVLDDQTQQRVLHCLRKLSEVQNEVMFVLSNLRFEHYLREPCFAAAAKTLPRPVDLKKQNQDRGDFDILIIHRHHGILACEIKAVGAMFSSLSLTEQQQLDRIEQKVKQAIKQLDKSGDVLSHLVSDMPSPPPIQKTLILPNVSTTQLRQVLDNSPQLLQDVRQCLGVQGITDPVPMCVTSHQLSDIAYPYDVTDNIIQQLGQWWHARMSGMGAVSLSDDMYLELLARFSGPATTVQVFCSVRPRLAMDLVRTEGEAASETGTRFSQLMLTPQQVSVHHSNQPLIFLSGPPGVGKSVMLILKGVDLLRQGLHVDVVSSKTISLAATHSAVYQLQQTAGPAAAGRIHLHHFDLVHGVQQAVDDAVRTLVEAANKRGSQGLYVIADEAWTGSEFKALVTALHHRVPRLVLWAAGVFHGSIPPLLTEVILTQPLRTPPSVTRQVQLSDYMRRGDVRGYTAASCPPPCDGSAPLYRYHTGQGHSAWDDPWDCRACGEDAAKLLTEDLHVGVTVTGRPSYTSQPPLQHRDVFVLCSSSIRSVRDTDGFVVGLRQGGLPVTVLRSGDHGAKANVATMSRDQVVVAEDGSVRGLERRVVVWVQGDRPRDGGQGDRPHDGGQGVDEHWGRLHSMSRCTGQLVCIMLPPESPP